jgi:PIN domain nuclease of toxin-antitoxin system
MRYLIDTNIFISIVIERDLFSDVREIIEDYENIIYVSSESLKEFIHLAQSGKVILGKSFHLSEIFEFTENTLGFHIKYVSKEHLQMFAKLDRVENHNDPSDRLIIAQALTEKIPLISSDTKFPKYRKQGLELIQNR